MDRFDAVWYNAHLATMQPDGTPYGAVRDGVVAARDGVIAYAGARTGFASDPRDAAAAYDCAGRWITPGLIDPHTHVVFGGDRVADFERRVAGESYVAASGGSLSGDGSGIAYTVARTRAASEDELFASAAARVRTMVANGTTTLEIKSGYGLDADTEMRMLRVARRIGDELGVSVRPTFLGAHVVPPEYAHDRDAYVRLVCDDMIPRIAREGLADAVDAFCDTIAFTPAETECVLASARAHGLPVKVHADQIADTGAAALAARCGATSADHLEHTRQDGVAALARAGTVAVVLPGAYYYLRETAKPPIDVLREHGVPIAIATDCNPGTSPVLTLPTAMNMACVLFGLTPEEALAGVTRNAARALGLHDRGILRAGMRCDLALWNVASPAELSYWLGASRCSGVVIATEPDAGRF